MFIRGPGSATADLLRNLTWCSYMDQVLAQLDLLRNLLAPGPHVRRLPPDEKMETLHVPALNVELTVFAQDQTDYEGVKVEGPFSSLNGVCLLPNELDEKVAKLHFLTLFSRRAGARGRLRHEPLEEGSARMGSSPRRLR